MIKIAICDDERKYLKKMADSINKILQREQIEEYEIDIFSSSIAFEKKLNEGQIYQVIFLDINMPQISGLELAKKIRKFDKKVILVFTTAFLDYAIEGYRLDVLRFLLKDMLDELLPECMDTILRKLELHTNIIVYSFVEGEKKVVISDIYYIESQKHKLIFSLLNNDNASYNLYNKLDNVEKQLSLYGFIRIHKSFLVNAMYIKSIINYKVKLKNGEELPIPRDKFQQIKEKYYSIKGDLV